MINKVNQTIIFYVALILLVLCTSFLIGLNFQYLISSTYFSFNNDKVDSEVMLVAIDEKTLDSDNFKRYQDINRADYATLLRNISYGHPKAIGVDVFFVKNSQNGVEDRELQNVLTQFPNIIIGSEVEDEEGSNLVLPFTKGDLNSVGYVNTSAYNNLDIFSFGLANYKNKIPMYFNGENVDIPLSLAVYKKVNNIQSIKVNKNFIDADGKKIPLQDSQFNVNYFADLSELKAKNNVISFYDVIAGNVNPEIFKDKIVFVGATAKDIHDEYYTPYDISDFMPGVLIHTNAYNTLTAHKYIYYPNAGSFLFIMLIFFIIFVISIVKSEEILKGVLYSGCALGAFILMSILSFVFLGYVIEVFPVIVGFILINLVLFFRKYFEEFKSKNMIKGVFSKYVSKEVVDEIVKVGLDNLKLGGDNKEVTVFFSDIAGFTSFSENLDPEKLGIILNVYFENMSQIILSKRGTIDKFIGDGIMAFWNAPLDVEDHQTLACEAAILQRKALDIVRQQIESYGLEGNIDMRIGISTGNVIVGNFGGSSRYNYTVLGDNVNLASRLESINKQYGTHVIISEETYKSINKEKFFIRELDTITVKGKQKPVRIYEIMDFFDPSNKLLAEKIKSFENALNEYRQGHFAIAKGMFDAIDDSASKLFSKRCEEFAGMLVGGEWDGVYKFKVK